MADIKETGGQPVKNGQHSNVKLSNGEHINGNAKDAKKVKQSAPGGESKGKRNSVISSLMQLRQASKRPLPTEMGDGSYRVVPNRPTLMQDLKSFGKDGEWDMLFVQVVHDMLT